MSAHTPRRPVLRPKPLSGLGVPYAREMRVFVDGAGALVVTRPGGALERIAGPGEITRVLFLDTATTRALLGRDDWSGLDTTFAGGIVLLAGVRPVLALRLDEWEPPTRIGAADLRITSGVQAVAAALGLPIEPVEARDRPLLQRPVVRQVQLRPMPPRQAPGKAALALAPIAMLAGFLGVPTGGRPVAAVLATLSLLLTAPVVLGVALGRRRSRAAAALAVPTGRGVLVGVRPGGRVPAGLLNSVLELNPDELFLRRRGLAVWLPGPAEGGIVQAVFEPEHVRLADAQGRDYAVLQTALWCADDAARAELADDLRAGGLRVLDEPVDTVMMHDTGDFASGRVKISRMASTMERGDPAVGVLYLGGWAAALATCGALGATGWNMPIGLVLFVLGLALFAVALTGAWRRASGERGDVRLVDASTRHAVSAH